MSPLSLSQQRLSHKLKLTLQSGHDDFYCLEREIVGYQLKFFTKYGHLAGTETGATSLKAMCRSP